MKALSLHLFISVSVYNFLTDCFVSKHIWCSVVVLHSVSKQGYHILICSSQHCDSVHTVYILHIFHTHKCQRYNGLDKLKIFQERDILVLYKYFTDTLRVWVKLLLSKHPPNLKSTLKFIHNSCKQKFWAKFVIKRFGQKFWTKVVHQGCEQRLCT